MSNPTLTEKTKELENGIGMRFAIPAVVARADLRRFRPEADCRAEFIHAVSGLVCPRIRIR